MRQMLTELALIVAAVVMVTLLVLVVIGMVARLRDHWKAKR